LEDREKVSNESGSAQDATAQFQEQLLGAIQTAQEATSSFVNAWFQGASQMVAAMASLTPPEPAVTLESNQLTAFMNQLFSSQQEFLTDLADKADPVSFMGSLRTAQAALVAKPDEVSAAAARLAIGIDAAVRATIARASGESVTLPIQPSKGDKRFSDRAYSENPLYVLLVQQYLLGCQYFDELLDAAELEGIEDAKARFATKFILDALAPTNTLYGNPAALREAADTGGASLIRGAKNMFDDVSNNGGWPRQADSSGFEVGVNLAATPGAVVFRNELIELIEYQPQTEKVYEVPLLFCPPWINKFYIMDLAPDKSLIEWAVQHDHHCFVLSYRNPDESMRDLGFADYLHLGLMEAVRVIRKITGAQTVNSVSLCLGGTLSAIALAREAAADEHSLGAATFLNTNTDFSVPGVLGLFTDESTIAGLEKQMDQTGYLEGEDMAHVFDVLRANDLVFQYVANNWLLGKEPPAFDLLVWNGDSTRMPAKMHSEYLRSCYLNNEFSQGAYTIDGYTLNPKSVEVETYVVAAINDHIVPWASGYKTAQMFAGPNRFVLTTQGHIAGVVNPPNPKAQYWTSDERPIDPDEWKRGAQLVNSTWWIDWTEWISTRAGNLKTSPKDLGTKKYPVLEAAPGSYVRERAREG
jgi:polyhydroxyalkanoate synthase